jgi:protocatechuate 3,4-dioxygenase beta subunit
VEKIMVQGGTVRGVRRREWTRTVRGSLIALALVAGGVAIAPAIGSSPALAASGTVDVTVFEDINFNGVQDAPSAVLAGEPGVAGVNVVITDTTGATVGTGATLANGTVSIPVSGTATTSLRVEFTSPLPAGYRAGPIGSGAGGTVQFVTLSGAGTASAAMGVTRPGMYAGTANPYMVVPTNRAVVDYRGVQLANPGGEPALWGYPYDSSGRASDPDYPATAGMPVELADQSQIGTTWGTANYRTNWALSAAAFRRGSPVGPGGLGQIYLTDVATAVGGTPNATAFVTIPNTGVSPRVPEGFAYGDWVHDPTAYANADKIGLGDIDVTTDMTKLYAVNLTDRNLYEVPLTPGATSAAAPTAGAPVAITLPLTLPGATRACAQANVRPYGLGEYLGTTYVTLTCTGPNRSDLTGYVYSMNETTHAFALVLETPLDDYTRGHLNPAAGAVPVTPGDWQPWTDTLQTLITNPAGDGITTPAQPLLSTITFDTSGNASLSIKNRNGDQGAWQILSPTGKINYTFNGGELLKFCGTPGAWTRESNGSCPAGTTGQAGLGYGPAGGLFYDANYNVNAGPGLTTSHQQGLLGSAVQVPGFSTIMATTYDPQPGAEPHTPPLDAYKLGIAQNGFRVYPNDGPNAGDTSRWGVLDAQSDSLGAGSFNANFGKGGGLGDLSAMLDLAPVEIGNLVWIDIDKDGVQDAFGAGEVPKAGVTVHLYLPGGTTPIATAVTDANGNYLFSGAAGTSTGSAIHNLDLLPNTQYEIRLDNPADFQPGGPLNGFNLTAAAQGGNTAVDSNGVPYPIPASSVIGANAIVTTPASGIADHTFDFGFTPTYSLGNRLWIDMGSGGTAGVDDGAYNAGEAPVVGASVTLLDALGQPVDNPFIAGTQPYTIQTDASGFYRFDGLDAGQYSVRVDQSNFVGGPLQGYLSSTPTPTGNNNDNGINNPTPTSGGVSSALVTLGFDGSLNDVDAGINSALSGNGPAGDSYDNLTVDFGFVQPFDLMITKTLNTTGTLVLGDPVSFNLDVQNNGPAAALTGFTVWDKLPAGLVFAAQPVTDPSGLWTGCTISAGDPQEISCTWSGGDLAMNAHAAPLTINATITVGTAATLTNYSAVVPSPNQPTIETNPLGTTSPLGLPPKYENGSNSNGSNNDSSVPVTIGPATYSLGNRLWYDTGTGAAFDNGAYDGGEAPVVGASVTLIDATTNLPVDNPSSPGNPYTIQTDTAGFYRFDGLTPGTYVVRVEQSNFVSGPLQGYLSSTPDLTGNNNDNGINNPTPTNGGVLSAVATLGLDGSLNDLDSGATGAGGHGQNGDSYDNLTVDFGFVLPPYDLMITKTLVTTGPLQLNNAVQFQLVVRNNGPATAVTGFTVRDKLPAGLVFAAVPTTDPTGRWIGCTITVGDPQEITCTWSGPNLAAGTNADPLFINAIITVDTAQTLTNYSVVLPSPNQPQPTETIPVGTSTTVPGLTPEYENGNNTPTPGNPSNNDSSAPVTIGPATYSLGNRLWFDTGDAGGAGVDDGMYTPGELPVVGASVTLLDATTGLPVDNPASPGTPYTIQTDAAGFYRFDGLAPGTYVVRVDEANFATGPLVDYLSSTPDLTGNNNDNGINNPTPATGGVLSAVATLGLNGSLNDLDAGATGAGGHGQNGDAYDNLTVDFGFVQPYDLMITKTLVSTGPFKVTDPVQFMLDVQNNGPATAWSGLTVSDRLPDGLVFATVPTTDPTGNWTNCTINGQEITCTWIGAALAAGDHAAPLYINAIITTGDAGSLTNYSVVKPNPQQPQPEKIPVGDTPDEYENGDNVPTPGSPSNNDDSVPVPVGPATYSLGNRLWFDTGALPGEFNNGRYDADETAVVGAIVELFADANGDGVPDTTTPIATDTTDASGYYRFDGLAPGTYVVRVAGSNFTGSGPLAGYNSATPTSADFTAAGNNLDHGINVANPAAAGVLAAPVTVGFQSAVGEVDATTPTPDSMNGPTGDDYDNLTVDFGFVRVVAVGDYTWLDTDRDGVQDAGESPLPGVTVKLLNPDGSPATDASGNPVPPVVTDSNGHYVIDNLLPGDYRAQFTAPPGYSLTNQNGGSSDVDSNPDVTTTVTPVFTIGSTVGGDTRTVMTSDGTTVATLINPTIDAGYVTPVEVAPPTPTTTVVPTPSTLPRTGGNTSGPVGLAFLLLAGGAAFVLVAIRRRRAPLQG